MKKSNLNINISKTDLRYLVRPLVIFAVILILLVTAVFIGIKQLQSVDSKIKSAKKLQTTLGQNLSTLRMVEQVVAPGKNFIEVVLPESGSAVFFINQIKSLALTSNLIITNIKTGINVNDEGGMSKTSVSFEAEGETENILTFLDKLQKALPISTTDKARITTSGNLSKISITVNVYSAEVPETVPALTDPVTELTNDEKDLLIKLTTFTLPNFIQPEATQNLTPRTDPFN